VERSFWQGRWDTGQIGFHEGSANRFLVRHAEQFLPQPGSGSVLVPLCGKSRDLSWLAARGHRVVGCELIETAARAFFAEEGVTPKERAAGPFLALSSADVTILVGDALALTTEITGVIDAVFDRAALVALPEEMRADYAAAVASVTRSGGTGLLVTLEHDAGSGPPFSIDRASAVRSYGGGFDITDLEREDVTAENANIVAKGATQVFEIGYRLVRR
jgi:thiopurine S-methyltransferase